MPASALRASLLLLDQSVDMKFTATDVLVGNAIFLRGEKFLYCLAEDGDRADLGAFGFFNSTRSGRFHAVTQRVALRSKPIFSIMRSSKSGKCAAP